MAEQPPQPEAPSEFVDEAYHLHGAEDMAGFYRKWAEDYDHEMLDKLGYTSPFTIAEMLARHLPQTDAAILDIGCGTGLTCRLLAERGYDRLDGIDLSHDMLKVARQRGIYRQLLQADVNQPLPLQSASYDGVISSGTFTHGHVGPEPLADIFRVLKPGGILACTVHLDLWQSLGFDERLRALVDEGVARQIHLETDSYYRDRPPEGWFCVYRKV